MGDEPKSVVSGDAVDVVVVASTGGQVDQMVLSLLDAAHEKNEAVKQSIHLSLIAIGKNKPKLMLTTVHTYLRKHSKLSMNHKVAILNAVKDICLDTDLIKEIDRALASAVIQQALAEMVMSKEFIPEWQEAASGVIVAIGQQFCNQSMDALLEKFQPGVLPHYFVLRTMANLATASVFSMVPFLTAALGTMLPMLGMAKQDSMRWIFAYTLSRFSEAILDYIVNIEKAPDKTVKKSLYHNEIDVAFDILFSVWLQSKSPDVRIQVIEAIGNVAPLMSPEKLSEQVSKVINGTLALYKKHMTGHYTITQALYNILSAALEITPNVLEAHTDTLLGTLFQQACVQPDFTNLAMVKNYNEVLRCFDVMTRIHPDRLIAFLLQKLDSSHERPKIGCLTVMKHLINSSTETLEKKREVIVSGLNIVLNEPNNKIKKVFAQVIIAMGHQGYLELEGGLLMVEFIVKQCALSPTDSSHNQKRQNEDASIDTVNNVQLRLMCENVLHLLTTTVDCMEVVLWPFLLEFLTRESVTASMAVVCKSLYYLANKFRSEQNEEYELDYDRLTNLPKPHAIISRLLVLSGRPTYRQVCRGVHTLQLMKVMAPNLHPNLVGLWDGVVPKLISYLEDALDDEDNWSQKNWEDLMLKMLSKTLDEVDSEEWSGELATAMSQQLDLYDYPMYVAEKNFLFKCIGIVIRKMQNREMVIKTLNSIFSSVKHSNQIEREGCAVGAGLAASSHLDTVLEKLDSVAKSDSGKKSSGLFSFIKDSSSDNVIINATVILSYGYVTLYAQPTLVVSRLESTIMRQLTNILKNVKDPAVKLNVIKCVELIGKAVNQDHLNISYELPNRATLITCLQTFVHEEYTKSNKISDTLLSSASACTSLIKLPPKLSDADIFSLLQIFCSTLCSLPEDCTQVSTVALTTKHKEESCDIGEREMFLETSIKNVAELCKEVLSKDGTADCLLTVFKHLEKFTYSEKIHEKLKSIIIFNEILCHYLAVSKSVGYNCHAVNGSSKILARMVPRFADPSPEVRKQANMAIISILQIIWRMQGLADKETVIENIKELENDYVDTQPDILFKLCTVLAEILCKEVAASEVEIFAFAETLLEGLTDASANSSSTACVMLNQLMKTRGVELHNQQSNVLALFADKLRYDLPDKSRKGTLIAIRLFANHDLMGVVNYLLLQNLPYDEVIKSIWSVLAVDSNMCQQMCDHFLELITKNLPYHETTTEGRAGEKININKCATVLPLSVISALTEILKSKDIKAVVTKDFYKLFSTVIISIGTYIDVKPPKYDKDKNVTPESMKILTLKPVELAVNCFLQLLECAEYNNMLDVIEENDLKLKLQNEDEYVDAVTIITDSFATNHPSLINNTVTRMGAVLSSFYENQRVIVMIFFAELINHQNKYDETLLEFLINSLLGRLVDGCHLVRMLSIRGLGNLAGGSQGNISENIYKHSTTVLSAMMAALDDKEDMEDLITLEAMNGLAKVLAVVSSQQIKPILINICLRIRSCLEKEKAAVRRSAFTVFGVLSRFGTGECRDSFLEQIHANMVSMLLHLNDKDSEVTNSCKYALRELSPLLTSTQLENMCLKHLKDTTHLHYGEFVNDLTKVIIADFPDKISFYSMTAVSFFKSMWPEIRSNAAMFVGFLLGNLPMEKYNDIAKEHIASALILLLKDSNPLVRGKAVDAMGLLYDL